MDSYWIPILGKPQVLDLPRYRVPRVSSSALPRTASFQLSSTAYRVFSTRHYRVPRLFNGALPRTASFQLDTTAYRVFSEGNYRIPRLFWDPPIEFRIHLCTGKLQRGLSVLLSYFSIIEDAKRRDIGAPLKMCRKCTSMALPIGSQGKGGER
jgi:hypothetical protein